MFHSLIHLCEVKRVWVALDESVEQCCEINGCERCPYEALFAAVGDEYRRCIERSKMAAAEQQVC